MNQPGHVPAEQGITSTAPIRDTFARDSRGVSSDGQYVVLPAAVLESLPLFVQQRFAQALGEIHRDAPASWPLYRVTPSTSAPVSEVGEHQLRDAGIATALTDDGHLEHQWIATGERVSEQHQVLVSCPDPLLPSNASQQ